MKDTRVYQSLDRFYVKLRYFLKEKFCALTNEMHLSAFIYCNSSPLITLLYPTVVAVNMAHANSVGRLKRNTTCRF